MLLMIGEKSCNITMLYILHDQCKVLCPTFCERKWVGFGATPQEDVRPMALPLFLEIPA